MTSQVEAPCTALLHPRPMHSSVPRLPRFRQPQALPALARVLTFTAALLGVLLLPSPSPPLNQYALPACPVGPAITRVLTYMAAALGVLLLIKPLPRGGGARKQPPGPLHMVPLTNSAADSPPTRYGGFFATKNPHGATSIRVSSSSVQAAGRGGGGEGDAFMQPPQRQLSGGGASSSGSATAWGPGEQVRGWACGGG